MLQLSRHQTLVADTDVRAAFPLSLYLLWASPALETAHPFVPDVFPTIMPFLFSTKLKFPTRSYFPPQKWCSSHLISYKSLSRGPHSGLTATGVCSSQAVKPVSCAKRRWGELIRLDRNQYPYPPATV